MISMQALEAKPYRSARVSRADLVICLGVDAQCLDAMADSLGYALQETKKHQDHSDKGRGDDPLFEKGPDPLPQPKPSRFPNLGFWKLVAQEQKEASEIQSEEPDWFKNAKALVEDALDDDFPTPAAHERFHAPELAPLARLWPFLRQTLGAIKPTRRLHERELVRRVGKGKPIYELPVKHKTTWHPVGHILVDRRQALAPFWADYETVIDCVVERRGIAGLSVCYFENGPGQPCRNGLDVFEKPKLFNMPPRGTPVLFIGDLGCYGTSLERQTWLSFGKALRAKGIQPVALVHVPPRMWDRRLEAAWTPVFWDRGQRLKLASDAARGAHQDSVPSPETLLELLAPAIRIEPKLLRAARFLFTQSGADVGTEYEVWHHPATVNDLITMTLLPAAIPKYRAAFRSLAPRLQAEFEDLLKRCHQTLPFSIQEEEHRILGTLQNAAVTEPHPSDFMTRVAKAIGDRSASPRLMRWFRRLSRRQDQWGWSHLNLAAAELLIRRMRGKPLAALPLGFPLDDVRWVLEGQVEPSDWTVFQYGQAMMAKRGRKTKLEIGSSLDVGQKLFQLSSRSGYLGIQTGAEPVAYVPITDDLELAMPSLAGGAIRVHTDTEVLTLDYQQKPMWARAIGRDARGVFAKLADKNQILYWLNPEHVIRRVETLDDDGEPLSRSDNKNVAQYDIFLARAPSPIPANFPSSLYLKKGRWVDKDLLDQWKKGRFIWPVWSKKQGVDQFGLYADLDLKGVVYRMRFIPPGEFLMGSPDDEPERRENEVQHSVSLTKGFWLGETTVTQELWQGVMGNNPSRFTGDDRPVEQVSWDDCQQMIKKASEFNPALNLRLPTETEWEYACRAETTTAFHFGDQVTTDQVNYDGNHPYNDGEKGKYRGETVPVYALPSNAWGLFQMHGNVWEWCSDWYSDYLAEYAIDSHGPGKGEARVLRGGSWIDAARRCRSAYRYGWHPSSRFHYVGFRLAVRHEQHSRDKS